MQSKRHVKRFFVFCTSVSARVRSYPTVWRKKNLPLKAILSFWSVWWNLWRGTARGLFCFWAVGEAVLQTIKSRLSYIRQEGRGYRSLQQTALPLPNSPVKTIVWCTLSYLPVPRRRRAPFCVCLFIFVRTSRWKRNAHPPSTLHLN